MQGYRSKGSTCFYGSYCHDYNAIHEDSGALLVSSLMVIPVATGIQLAKSFKQATLLSVVAAEVAAVSGIIASYYLELASGGTIVLLSVALLMLVLGVKSLLRNI